MGYLFFKNNIVYKIFIYSFTQDLIYKTFLIRILFVMHILAILRKSGTVNHRQQTVDRRAYDLVDLCRKTKTVFKNNYSNTSGFIDFGFCRFFAKNLSLFLSIASDFVDKKLLQMSRKRWEKM